MRASSNPTAVAISATDPTVESDDREAGEDKDNI